MTISTKSDAMPKVGYSPSEPGGTFAENMILTAATATSVSAKRVSPCRPGFIPFLTLIMCNLQTRASHG
jgi:hypothetical protein